MEITDTFPRASETPTRERVAHAILEHGPSTAASLAERLDLTPAAVRRHLDHLTLEGLVEAREQRVYGRRGRGRPAKVFALTRRGRDMFHQEYDDLAVEALRFLQRTGGEQAVRAFAEERASLIAIEFAKIHADHPERTHAEILAEVFSAQGYAATVHDLPVGEQLCQQHCPVAHVAHEFPQLCEAETDAIATIVGSHVQRLATIAHGAEVCTTFIPLDALDEVAAVDEMQVAAAAGAGTVPGPGIAVEDLTAHEEKGRA